MDPWRPSAKTDPLSRNPSFLAVPRTVWDVICLDTVNGHESDGRANLEEIIP